MSGDVVRLANASRRIVQQPARFATRAEYRDAHPWPGKFQWPFERQIEADAKARVELGHGSPAHVLLIALYAALEPAQRLEAHRMMILGKVAGLPAFCASIDLLEELAGMLRRDAESIVPASRAEAAE